MGAGKIMVRITVDEELRKKFLNFTKDFELCDENGKILARLQSVRSDSSDEQWEFLTPEVSDEEIQRRLKADEPTLTTSEVIEHLRSL